MPDDTLPLSVVLPTEPLLMIMVLLPVFEDISSVFVPVVADTAVPSTVMDGEPLLEVTTKWMYLYFVRSAVVETDAFAPSYTWPTVIEALACRVDPME